MFNIKRLSEKILKKPLTREVTLYICVGMLTTVVGFVSYSLFLYIGLGVAVSNTISHFLAILFAYVANKIWVFRALDFAVKTVAKEFLKFLSGRFVTYVVDTMLLILLVEVLSYNPLISKLLTSLIVIMLNYLVSRTIVFRKR